MRYFKFSISLGLVIFYFSSLLSQQFPESQPTKMTINKGSEIETTPCIGTIRATEIESNWGITVQKLTVNHHATAISVDSFQLLKTKAAEKRNIKNNNKQTSTSQRNSIDPPLVYRNFRGNKRENNVPMDNSMAISKNGFIVSAINSNVIFTQPDGSVTYEKSLYDFFTLLTLGTRMYDPRVIYDQEMNRFILLCLHGSDYATSYLCIAASKTEDPNGEWNYYKIKGNPLGDQVWFDYPNIGLTKNDYYIAGLERNSNSDWQYSILFQIDKSALFNGEPLKYKYYSEIFDADGNKSFNLVPAISAWNDLPSPGMYMVSNNANGGNTYNLYQTDSALNDSTKLISTQLLGLKTELAPNARQPNSNQVLNTFDSRIWSASFLNNVVHFGGHANTENGDVGIFYGRYNVVDNRVDVTMLTEPNKDYAFPSFSSFGTSEGEPSILMHYLSSGPNNFASQEVRVCQGIDGDFEWSAPSMLKEGTSVINVLQDNEERWGDYTTVQRRFFNDSPEVWAVGCFGEAGSYGTWLGQMVNIQEGDDIHHLDFVAEKTYLQQDAATAFKVLTLDTSYQVTWFFENGNPETSTAKNPKVSWEQIGAYQVEAQVTSNGHEVIVQKQAYIHVAEPVVKPTADFTFSADTIYVGESVKFFNQSSSNAVNFKWNFQSGTPASSQEKNPEVSYQKAGSFLVSLTASNIAGTNTKIVSKAITVLPHIAPTVDFTSDKNEIKTGESVQFTSITKGGINNYAWEFEGGTPASSTEASPIIVYNSEGIFSVKLVGSNEIGADSLVKSGYIIVGPNQVKDDNENVKFTLIPNPVTNGYAQLLIHHKTKNKVRLDLINSSGAHLVTLYDDILGVGEYKISFNADQLLPGTYFISYSENRNVKKNIQFIKI
ncbi:MAG: PKD domain-containing protein [Lewinellaceae bacterium]|nr:PKD domain-containing protein [Lewinellaceae bacterium]